MPAIRPCSVGFNGFRERRRATLIRYACAFGFSIAIPKRIFGWLRPWPVPRSRDAKMSRAGRRWEVSD